MWVSMAWCENRSKVSREDIVRGMGKRHSGPDGLKDGARRVLVLESRDSGWLVMTFFDSVEEMGAHQTRLGTVPEQVLPPNTRLTGLEVSFTVLEMNAPVA